MVTLGSRRTLKRFDAARTRTLPSGATESLGIALASCSNFAFGYFNAYRAIAEDESIDFVLHTGDYIYEYGADGWGAETAERLGRVHEPAHEIVSLADYRARHAQYKRDPDSQAMHATHPLMCCWDDHESTNNPWSGGAQNHQPEEGSWNERRDASVRAYYEWMPIREPEGGLRPIDFWRVYSFGDLATLVTLVLVPSLYLIAEDVAGLFSRRRESAAVAGPTSEHHTA